MVFFSNHRTHRLNVRSNDPRVHPNKHPDEAPERSIPSSYKLPCSTPDADSVPIESIHFMASCSEGRRRLRARYQKCGWGQ
jgi:hypothetical protein